MTRNLITIAAAGMLLLGCQKSDQPRKTLVHVDLPVQMNIADLRASSYDVVRPREIKRTGKIYVYGDYLFVTEPNVGIHVIDNRRPSQPLRKAFINIPGVNDLGIRNDVLYADSYIDLVAYDVRNKDDIRFMKRVENVFPQYYYNKNNGTFYAKKDTLVVQETPDPRRMIFFDAAAANFLTTTGQAGSTSRFAIMNDYLYTVSSADLRLFDIRTAGDPQFVKTVPVNGTIVETIFPYRNNLFIGTTTGMHIFDAQTPGSPVKLSTFGHLVSCDPVVVQGNMAYSTLRQGTNCWQGINALDVIDVSDLKKPTLVKSYPMDNPHGLAINGSSLYICEGNNGLKLLNAADPKAIFQTAYFKNLTAIDVIDGPRSVIVVGHKTISQFVRGGSQSLLQVSSIPVNDPATY